jgi:hypothetical protein
LDSADVISGSEFLIACDVPRSESGDLQNVTLSRSTPCTCQPPPARYNKQSSSRDSATPVFTILCRVAWRLGIALGPSASHEPGKRASEWSLEPRFVLADALANVSFFGQHFLAIAGGSIADHRQLFIMRIYKRAIASLPFLALCLCAVSLRAQETAPAAAPAQPAVAPAQSSEPKKDETKKDDDKSAGEIVKESTQGTGGAVLGVLPNFRSTNSGDEFKPLPAKAKWLIGFKDSFYYTVYLVSGLFAGLGQLDGNHPQFGQGVEGYAKRYVTSYADQAIGNIMTESLFPVMLHEDPRYFRQQTGSVRSRLGSAVAQIFVTRTDSGGRQFNFSEIVGNGVAAGLSDLYYKDSRNFSSTGEQWFTAVATDTFSNVLKEFWPDIKRRMTKKHDTAVQP